MSDRVREDLKISLTDREYISLKLKAYEAGFETPEEFLAMVIGDIVASSVSGTDERDLINAWYDKAFGWRTGYSFFRYHLFNYDYSLENMAEMLSNDDFFEAAYQEYLDESMGKACESRESCLTTLREIVAAGAEL